MPFVLLSREFCVLRARFRLQWTKWTQWTVAAATAVDTDADFFGPKPQAASPKPQAASPKPQAASPKPQASNPKPMAYLTPYFRPASNIFRIFLTGIPSCRE